MKYKFTIIFNDVRDFEQADEYTDKIGDFIDKEITEDWSACGEMVNNNEMD